MIHQGCAYRLSQPPSHHDYDHRYNWSPYPTNPIGNLPPWAPPIYHSVPNTPRGVGHQYRRPPPTLFDSVDFPPPYTSREPSIAGRCQSHDSLEMEYTFGHRGIPWDRLGLGPSIFRFFRQNRIGRESDDSFDCIGHSDGRVLGSSSGTSDGVLLNDNDPPRDISRNLVQSTEYETFCQSQDCFSHQRDTLLSSSTESDSERQHDNVFISREILSTTSDGLHPSHSNPCLAQTHEENTARRHSWVAVIRTARSSDVYSAHDEIQCAHVAPNTNPWVRSMSGNEAHGYSGERNTSLHPTKQRSNSTPCYTGDHVTIICDNGNSLTDDEGLDRVAGALQNDHQNPSAVCPEENRSLFRNFTESSKSTGVKARKKRRRPRNNPGHILEHSVYKEFKPPNGSAQETRQAAYRETTV